jgi:RNA polymerase sporulation-specific sigma factor
MIYDLLFLSEELPKALTSEEMIEYFKKFQAGDLNAREEIITHNIRLVISQVFKKFNDCENKSDLISIGIIGLIKSVDTFDITKNVQFSTYSCKCIDREILSYLRKKHRHDKVISLDEELSNLDNGKTFKDILEDPTIKIEDDYEDKELKEIVRLLVNEIEGRNKDIILLYFGFNGYRCHTMREIGEIYNLSKYSVLRIIKKELAKMKIKIKELDSLDIDNKEISSKTKPESKSTSPSLNFLVK